MWPEFLLAKGKPCLPQAGSNAERQLCTLQSGLWLIYKDGFDPVVTKTQPPHRCILTNSRGLCVGSLQYPVSCVGVIWQK